MMFLVQFYRFYCSLVAGIATYFFYIRSLWIVIPVTLFFRILWYIVEKQIIKYLIGKNFNIHSGTFKELTGPYGVRLVNKADRDQSIKKSLSEVFVTDIKKLRKTVEQLELMDTLFKSGLSPDGDTYQLHDLKLKYAKHRLENITDKD